MCTTFLHRGNDIIIGMNFDNHGHNFKIAPHRDDLFYVTLQFNGEDIPLMGVRADGLMTTQQLVNEGEGGTFRVGENVLDTAAFVGEILQKPQQCADLDAYTREHTIVNLPDYSIHVLIAQPKGTSYVLDPARGMVTYPKDDRFIAFTNCPIIDHQKTGKWEGLSVERQLLTEECMRAVGDDFSVQDAFAVLDKVHQEHPLWTTEFSFVYSYNQNTVYHCVDRQFDKPQAYKMVR